MNKENKVFENRKNYMNKENKVNSLYLQILPFQWKCLARGFQSEWPAGVSSSEAEQQCAAERKRVEASLAALEA
jgi:hypothetical protein